MRHRINYFLLGSAFLLLAFGLLFLAALSSIQSLQVFGNTNYYIFHQLIAAGIGLVLGLIVYKIPLGWIKKLAPIFFFANLALLAVVFLPAIGIRFWGANRWINIGPLTLQPSEFLKISAIIYLSAWLANRMDSGASKKWAGVMGGAWHEFMRLFVPFIILLSLIAGLMYFQKDASTLAIIIISLVAVYFAAKTPLWHTILLGALGAGAGLLLIKLEPYRLQRLLVFLHPETDPLGIGFQLKQSLIAMGSGGWFGKGLGMSTQKFGYLPQAMSDSVFAILGEELGIIGCLVVIILFLTLFWQCLKMARRTPDLFSRLVAVGIGFWIIIQALMNIASAAGIFPLSGVPLPFFSYGGSHIMAELIAVGLLLNISKHA